MKFNQLKFIEKVYPLHRTLVSDDIDLTLNIISENLPLEFKNNFKIVSIESGTKCWTWITPKKYVVKKAYIEDENGNKILDFFDNYLHLVSYSQPVNTFLTFEELEKKLFFNKKRPNAIPWKFYYYKEDWGFCLSYNQFLSLDKNIKYKVVIDCEFKNDFLKVGELLIKGKKEEEILIVTNICHPYQVNDSITGVSSVIEMIYKLTHFEFNKSLRILFLPETIGSICYFASDEKRAQNIKYGIFTEMLGNNDSLALQHSFQKNTLVDYIAEYVLKINLPSYRKGNFREIVGNDELVTNGPGLNIPTISISRSKITLDSFPEYHTSDDNPSIIIEDNLIEASNILFQIIKIYMENYTPKRNFKGPIFLSGYNLWGIWGDLENGKEIVDLIMYHLEGNLSIFEISQILNQDYYFVKNIIDSFYEKGLVEKV